MASYKVIEPSGLMEFLSVTFPDSSRSKLKGLLAHQKVSVGGKIITKYDFPLEVGMEVEIQKKADRIFRNKRLEIVYEDDFVIVINKSEGLLSVATERGEGEQTARSILDDYMKRTGHRKGVYVVHRLDRDTSGLMMFAKSEEAQQRLRDNWKEIVYDRRYIALADGLMEEDSGTVHTWLTDRVTYVSSCPYDDGGQEAITHYRTIKRANRFSLVELRLETGRRNQIRVHLMNLGHPVLGDGRYGYEDMPNPVGRLALHAFKLCFYHPITGKPMAFETPYPLPFVKVVEVRKRK
jgi:23S rRNA pseudouridine1911/1915/1917 synthase